MGAQRSIAAFWLRVTCSMTAVSREEACMPLVPATPDRLLARYARTGDPAALGDLFDQTAAELLRVALWLSGNRADADDLVQRTFLTVIEQRAAYDARRRALPWLTGIVGNHARKLHERRGRQLAPVAPPSEAPDPAGVAAANELVDEVVRLRADLTPAYAEVLDLHLREGLNAKEIAARLQRPAGTVRTQLVRALEQLRKRLPASFVPGAALLGLPRAAALDAIRRSVLHAAERAPATVGALGLGASVAAGAVASKKAWLVVPLVGLLLGLLGYEVWPRSPARANPTVGAVDLMASGPSAPRPHVSEAAPESPARAEVDASPAGDDPGFASVHVRMRWADDGSPAVALGVFALPFNRPQVWERDTRTDGEGTAVLPHLAPGDYFVGSPYVADEPYLRLAAGERRDVELVATRAGRVQGVVVDTGGQPVADADILVSQPHGWGKVVTVGRSDAQGAFSAWLRDANHYVGAAKSGFSRSHLRRLPRTPAVTENVVLRLGEPAGTVAGTVVDAGGRPVAWATVRVGRGAGAVIESGDPNVHLVRAPSARAVTGSDGRFAVDDVPAGPQPVDVWAPGFGAVTVVAQVEAGRETALTVPLERGAIVRGNVSDAAGQAVAGARVYSGDRPDGLGFWNIDARTDASGSFELEGLPRGRVTVAAVKEEDRARAQLDLVAGAASVWNPTLGRGRTIAGRVLGPDGRGLLCSVGVVQRSRHQVQRWFATDAEGAFALENVGDEPCKVQVGIEGTTLVELRGIAPDRRDLLIRLGERDLPSAYLRGRIVDAAGCPARGNVFLSGTWSGVPSRALDANGVFTFGPIPARRYDVGAFVDDVGQLALGFVALEVGEQRVIEDVVLQPTGDVEITVVDAAQSPVTAPHVRVYTAEGRTLNGCEIAQGHGRLARLQPGRYLIDVWANVTPPQILRGEVTVRSGQTAHLEVRGCAAAPVTFAFVDPTAVADLSVRVSVRDPEGRLAGFAGTFPENLDPLRCGDSFPPGVYDVACEASDGRRASARLTVRSPDDNQALTITLPR
ncbi:MAG: sigma-70 family RNA polymerase sigma factor [Planctomycetota bacterium]